MSRRKLRKDLDIREILLYYINIYPVLYPGGTVPLRDFGFVENVEKCLGYIKSFFILNNNIA